MNSARSRRGSADHLPIARVVAGCIWLGGAVFNALVTSRLDAPYAWLADGSRVAGVRWFFGDIVAARPEAWTVALAIGEACLGGLTLSRGRRAWPGLAGGAAFSVLLFALVTPYTVVMGPYGLYLAWLAREQYRRSRDTVLTTTLSSRNEPGAPARARRDPERHIGPLGRAIPRTHRTGVSHR